MASMALVALAAAVVALGLVAVSGVLVWRAIGGLRHGLTAARERLEPYRAELAAEQATLRLELEGLQRRCQGPAGGGRPPRRSPEAP